MIKVTNLSTGETRIYDTERPELAVKLAYLQGTRKDYNTADYDLSKLKVTRGHQTVACGDWCAMCDTSEADRDAIAKRLPTISDLYRLCRAVKADIAPEYRAFEDDSLPGIQLTVGWNPETGEWSYQTGDNSYTGGAYLYPIWAVIGVYRSSNCRELAHEIREQLLDQADY